jgi:ribonuclease P protein component
MLSKKNRANTKTVEEIFRNGKTVNSAVFSFKFLPNIKHQDTQISVIASKNITKIAVKRNLLRRRGYSTLKKFLHLFPSGIEGVLIFKKYEDSKEILEREIKTILNKLN